MEILDHERYDVVGIVTQMGLSQNALITGIGLADRNTGEFIPVPSSERNKVFSSRGNVFAYDFLKRHPNWVHKCVCLTVKPNVNTNIVNGEDFVWDWKYEEYIYADRIKKLKTPLSEDGGINNDILVHEGILPCDSTQYFLSDNLIFRVDPKMRILPYWKLSEIESSYIAYEGNIYLFGDITQTASGNVDLTSDEQIIEWYKKNILKREWNTIYEAKSFQSVDAIVTAELKKLKIPTNVYESRLGRIMNLTANISLTFEELEDLSTAPWFSDTVLNAINQFADSYISKVKKEYADEINELKKDYENQLSELTSQFEKDKAGIDLALKDKQDELSIIATRIQQEEAGLGKKVQTLKEEITTLDSEIETKSAEIERLSSHKDAIIEDFSIIKDVLSVANPIGIQVPTAKVSVTEYDLKDEREFPTAGPFRKNIESLQKKFSAPKVPVDEIVTNLALHNIILFPDSKTLIATLQATRRSKYVVSYVGVDWKSYDNLWNSGLSTIVEEATKNPEIIHFLVLRNINMSYIPCYLQPVVDMEMGLIDHFPGTSIGFPENLRILCTRSYNCVIPVTESSLSGIGCIQPSEEMHSGSGTLAEGYLPTSVFTDLPIDESYCESNVYDSYIDE